MYANPSICDLHSTKLLRAAQEKHSLFFYTQFGVDDGKLGDNLFAMSRRSKNKMGNSNNGAAVMQHVPVCWAKSLLLKEKVLV